MQPITDTETLSALCERLSSKTYITVDTEFMREKTFWAQLCLIQVASDEEEAAIDALAPDLDLSPFWDLMNEAAPIKVFHAARQDLEIFYKQSGKLPNKIFDTQVAAMVCGFGESAGYQTLVHHFTDMHLDKSARFTDWGRRPLSDRQISYALSDVTLLRTIYDGLLKMLEENERLPWIAEEMATLMDPSSYEFHPEEAWRRVKHRSRDPKFLGRLKAVAAWRESEAQTRNLPRNRIVRDETLLEMAAHPPKDADDLAKMRGVSDKFANGPLATTLFAALDEAKPLPKSELPPRPERYSAANSSSAVTEMLKLLLKIRAKETGVAQKLIAGNDEIELLALKNGSDLHVLSGWRAKVFGEDALKLKRGEVALAVDGDSIVLVPRNA